MTFHHIRSHAQMAEAIMRLEQAGAGWHVPLFRAAMAGDLRLVLVAPGQRVPLRILDMQRDPRPLAVMLCGDSGGPDSPDAFPQARRLIRWAGFILLHGAGGEAWHYAMAAEATIQARRALMVETTSAALPAWIALKQATAPATPAIGWQVPNGGSHPVATVPAGAVFQ